MHFLLKFNVGDPNSIKPILTAANPRGVSGAENTRSTNPHRGLAPTKIKSKRSFSSRCASPVLSAGKIAQQRKKHGADVLQKPAGVKFYTCVERLCPRCSFFAIGNRKGRCGATRSSAVSLHR